MDMFIAIALEERDAEALGDSSFAGKLMPIVVVPGWTPGEALMGLVDQLASDYLEEENPKKEVKAKLPEDEDGDVPFEGVLAFTYTEKDGTAHTARVHYEIRICNIANRPQSLN